MKISLKLKLPPTAYYAIDLKVILDLRITTLKRLRLPKFTESLTTAHARPIFNEQGFLIILLSAVGITFFYNTI
jgi:hypothetical protein